MTRYYIDKGEYYSHSNQVFGKEISKKEFDEYVENITQFKEVDTHTKVEKTIKINRVNQLNQVNYINYIKEMVK